MAIVAAGAGFAVVEAVVAGRALVAVLTAPSVAAKAFAIAGHTAGPPIHALNATLADGGALREANISRGAGLTATRRVVIERTRLALWAGEGQRAHALAPSHRVAGHLRGVVAAVSLRAGHAAIGIVGVARRAGSAVSPSIIVRGALVAQRPAPLARAVTCAASLRVAARRPSALAAVREGAHKGARGIIIVTIGACGAGLRGVPVRRAIAACWARPLPRADAGAPSVRVTGD